MARIRLLRLDLAEPSQGPLPGRDARLCEPFAILVADSVMRIRVITAVCLTWKEIEPNPDIHRSLSASPSGSRRNPMPHIPLLVRWMSLLNLENYLNRKLSRESWPIAVQPISFMSRSISVRIKPRARSTPGLPAAARG